MLELQELGPCQKLSFRNFLQAVSSANRGFRRAGSSLVERFTDNEEVDSSILSQPT